MKVKTLFILVVLTCITMCACGKEEVPDLTDKILEKTAPEIIKEDIYFDQMADTKFEFTETTDEEMNVLKKKFDYQVPYQSVHLSANISSISMDAFIEYNIVYIYNNVEWKPIYCYAVNEEKWEYDAKEFASLKQIMNDIKKFQVGNFEKGYVGDENNSSIEIIDRKYEKQVNRDTVNCNLTVNTDFGTYTSNINAIYYFKKGEWEIGDFTIPPMSEWKFEYSPDIKINLVSDSIIKQKLTTKKEFLTYITNKKYISSDSLIQTGMEASLDNVTYHYKYTADYKKIGSISYTVDVIYKWLSFEWAEPTFNITANSQDLTKILNKKFKGGKQNITFNTCKQYDTSLKDDYQLSEDEEFDIHSSFIEAEYFDGTGSHKLLLNLVIPLRDNDYEINVIGEITDDGIKKYNNIDKIHLFVNNVTLQINNVKFK